MELYPILIPVGLMLGIPMTRMICGWADEKPVTRSPACSCGERWPALALLIPWCRCRSCASRAPGWLCATPWVTAALFVLAEWCIFGLNSHALPAVSPDPFWIRGRFVFHLLLIVLLVLATGTVLREYVVTDQITLPGTVLGLSIAAIAGNTQIMHIWVDWSAAIPGLRGPDIPEWVGQSPHWHGLAWSLAGLIVGAGITWIVRILSRVILGQPALGFGDVTLMAMVGSFLGWQPVVFVFLIAPGCAMVFGALIRIFTGRGYLAFGPYLSMGALFVLLGWRWLWTPTRDVFGHIPSIGMLAGVSLGTLVILLTGVRVFRAIPVRSK